MGRPGPRRAADTVVSRDRRYVLDVLATDWREEARFAAQAVARSRFAEHVLVAGHPYVDVWEAVRPEPVGLQAWPAVPGDTPWKEGALASLGWPCSSPADVATGWRRILCRVRSYADLEPSLLGRVEELIDFVTADRADTCPGGGCPHLRYAGEPAGSPHGRGLLSKGAGGRRRTRRPRRPP